MYIETEEDQNVRINEENYVDQAEQTILHLQQEHERSGKRKEMVTTSKLRSILAMAADIYNQILNESGEKLSTEICGRISYLRVRVIYECGREIKVKEFVNQAGLLEILSDIKGSRKNYLLFHKYMEALVAFHRFYGGKEQ